MRDTYGSIARIISAQVTLRNTWATPDAKPQPEQERRKKEKKKPQPEEQPVGPSAFDMLDVRVGRIVEAWEHPDSEKLWCERSQSFCLPMGEEEGRGGISSTAFTM